MARVEITRKYIADDGKQFDTKEACEAYELSDQLKPLTKMTLENLQAIMAGQDETRAALFRRVLSAINKPESGGRKKAAPRSPEEIAASLEARLAKVREKAERKAAANGSYAEEGQAGF